MAPVRADDIGPRLPKTGNRYILSSDPVALSSLVP
jgi:hypothetical protein